MPFTYQDFHKSWQDIHDKVPSYRFGQHFINLFIVDSSSDTMQKLWSSVDEDETMNIIIDTIEGYCWSWSDLPLKERA